MTWNAEPPATLGYLLLAAILAGFGFADRGDDDSGELDNGLLFVNGLLMRMLELRSNRTPLRKPAPHPSAACTAWTTCTRS